MTFCISLAYAAPITLYDWAFNVNGMTYEAALGDTLPGDFNDDNFNWDSGIGTLFVTFSPSSSGDYSILGFFDHEIVEDTNLFLTNMLLPQAARSQGKHGKRMNQAFGVISIIIFWTVNWTIAMACPKVFRMMLPWPWDGIFILPPTSMPSFPLY